MFIERLLWIVGLLDCWIAGAIVLQTNAKILHIVWILCKAEHVMKLKKHFHDVQKNVELSSVRG